MINIKVIEALVDIKKGMGLINYSLSCNNEDGILITSIFNGDTNERKIDTYTNEKYFFKNSFDEEYEEYNCYLEEYLEKLNVENINKIDGTEEPIISIIKGFDFVLEGLCKIVEEIKLDNEIKTNLKDFVSEDGYNPFKFYGFSEFERKFRGFRKAFLAELKRQLGRRKFESYEIKIKEI